MEKLTDQQIQKLQALQFELRKEMIALQSQMQIKRLETQQLWRADELDENAILEKTKEIAQLQSEQHEKAVRHRLQAAQILTKEQRDELIQSEHFGHRLPRSNRGHRAEGHHGGRAPKHRGVDDKGADNKGHRTEGHHGGRALKHRGLDDKGPDNKGHRTEEHHGGRAPKHRGLDDKGPDDGRAPQGMCCRNRQ
jgi:Spy/CpxP family protein refolding chaperone